MRRVHNGWVAMTAALSLAIAGAACGDGRDARHDTPGATDTAREGADAARAEGREAADDARQTAADATGAVGAAAETIDVKTALMRDDSIDSDDINVDTFHESKRVVLKGSVPSEAQKNAAERVASRAAEGYTIDNQLQVRQPR